MWRGSARAGSPKKPSPLRYCALRAPDFESALRLAVNHGGDSDSTGSLTGNLLGAALGEDVIPARWLGVLELRDEIERMADELCAALGGG